MSICIADLPWDIVNCVAGYLNIKDYVCLSNTSRSFYRDLQDEGIARKCLQVRISVRNSQTIVLNPDSSTYHSPKMEGRAFQKLRLADAARDSLRSSIPEKLYDKLNLTQHPSSPMQRASSMSRASSVIQLLPLSAFSISEQAKQSKRSLVGSSSATRQPKPRRRRLLRPCTFNQYPFSVIETKS
jgi:hypothetical protein